MAERVNRRTSNGSYRSAGRRDSSSDDNVDVFSDDFAVDAFPVADGFRPTQPSATREIAPRPITPPRTNKPAVNDESKSDIARRMGGQSSLQAAAARNSFSLQHDASDTPQRIPSMHQSDISRRISTISSTSTAIPRTQSPYVGASAPSHPYGMYPQDTQLNRASTISSIRPSRPTHPYGMYPQGTLGEADASPLAQSTDIASVGFPGLGQRYARRLGPDGEDADDIIGPDGHTEQLPPYTRFPDGVPPKETPSSTIAEAYGPGAPGTPESTSPIAAVLPGGVVAGDAIERADGNGGTSAPQSMTDGSQNSQEHLRSKEKWVEKGKQRTCFGRLPVWAVALIIGAVVIVAAVVGALIGHMLGQGGPRHHPPGPPPSTMISTGVGEPETTSAYAALTTTMVDAVPFPSPPANLPALPTGNFGVPIDATTDSSSSCLETNLDQQLAWGCLMGGYMSFNVSQTDDDNYQVSMDSTWQIQARGLQYGPQAPRLRGPAGLALMQDVNQPYLGPAYYFCQDYDKLVILPEPSINTSTQSKRSVEERSLAYESLITRDDDRGLLKPGQKPWFCWWNSTYLEGFIYLNQDSTSNLGNVSNIISSMNSLETPAPLPAATTAAAAATTTGGEYGRLRERDGEDGSEFGVGHAPYGSVFHHENKDSDDDDDNDNHFGLPASFPAVYPKAVKLEERRIVDKKYKPYCDQMQVLDNWHVGYAPNPNGEGRITMQIDEMSPPQRRAIYADVRAYNSRKRRRDAVGDDNGCHCEWMAS